MDPRRLGAAPELANEPPLDALAELGRLAEAERELDAQLSQIRARIATLMARLVPAQNGELGLAEIRTTTGYDPRLIEALRTGHHSWRLSP